MSFTSVYSGVKNCRIEWLVLSELSLAFFFGRGSSSVSGSISCSIINNKVGVAQKWAWQQKIFRLAALANTAYPMLQSFRHRWPTIYCLRGVAQHLQTFIETKYRQFATYSNYWRNVTLTSTLLNNYCKHSINPKVWVKPFVHLSSQHTFVSY